MKLLTNIFLLLIIRQRQVTDVHIDQRQVRAVIRLPARYMLGSMATARSSHECGVRTCGALAKWAVGPEGRGAAIIDAAWPKPRSSVWGSSQAEAGTREFVGQADLSMDHGSAGFVVAPLFCYNIFSGQKNFETEVSVGYMNRRSKQLSFMVSIIVFIGLIGTFFLGCHATERNVNEDLTRLDLKKIHEELDHFKRDVGRYPSSEENLKALVEKPANAPGWKGPYLRIFPMDSWGHPFIYRGPSGNEDSFELYSLGRDGREGTNDDVFFKGPPDRRRTKR